MARALKPCPFLLQPAPPAVLIPYSPGAPLAKGSTGRAESVERFAMACSMHWLSCMRNMTLLENLLDSPVTAEVKPLVLVAEDDPDAQHFIMEALKREGMSCLGASTVAEAIAELRREKPALTVLDWGLDRSGSEVLSVAKQLYASMPVVAISGMPFEVRTDAVVSKADAFLSKPFSATVLTSQVKQLIERSRQAPGIPLPHKPEDILPLAE